MSGYFSKFTGITMNDINKTLTVVSNIMAPIEEDEEFDSESVDDLKDLASTISAVGDIMKSSIMSNVSSSARPSGGALRIPLPESSFEEVSLSSSSPSSPFPQLSTSDDNVAMEDSFDWSPVPNSSKVAPRTGGKTKQDIASLDSSELESTIQTKYLGRMEGELEKLAVRIKMLEAENNALRRTQSVPSMQTRADHELLAQLESFRSRVQELETSRIETEKKTEAMVCRLISEHDSLEEVVRSKEKIIESMTEALERKVAEGDGSENIHELKEQLKMFDSANLKLIEEVQELENIVSIGKAENAELMFALDLEKRKVSALEASDNDRSIELRTMKENEKEFTEFANMLSKQLEELKENPCVPARADEESISLERQSLETMISDLQFKLRDQEDDLTAARLQVTTLEEKVDAAKSECKRVTEELEEEHRKGVSQLGSEIARLTDAMTGSHKDESTGLISALQNEIIEKQQQIEEAAEREANMLFELKALEEMIESLTKLNKDGQSELASKALALVAKTSECDHLHENIAQLTQRLHELSTDMNITRENAAQATSVGLEDIENLRKELDTYRLLCKNLEARAGAVSDLENKICVLETEKNSAIENFQSVIADKNCQIDVLTSKIESYRAKCDEMQSNIEALEVKLFDSHKQLSMNSEELAVFDEKCKTLQSQAERVSELEACLLSIQNDKCASCSNLSHELELSAARLKELESLSLESAKREENLQRDARNSDDLIAGLRKSLDEVSQQCNKLSIAAEEASKIDAKSQAFTGQIQKLEVENKQLHQVILQLRNVRKVSKEDVDSLQVERDELKRNCDLYKAENAQLSERLKSQEEAVHSASKLQEEITEFQGKILEYEEARHTGMLVIDEKKREIARLEKIIYDSQVANDVSAADIRMLNEDLTRKDMELQNLRHALERAESEQEQTKQILHNDFEKKLVAIESKCKTDMAESDALWEIKLKDVSAAVKITEQLLQDARILQRKAEVDLAAEKKRMQKTVEHAISQIRNTVDDVVDRALIANLLVSYFKRNRSREVMDLIAKVLDFNDDQKVIVGLKVGNIGFRHAVGTIFKSLVGNSQAKTPQEIEGENLAELWVNFLMTETSDEGKSNARLSRSPLSIRARISGVGSGSDTDTNETCEDSFSSSISLVPSSPTVEKSGGKRSDSGGSSF